MGKAKSYSLHLDRLRSDFLFNLGINSKNASVKRVKYANVFNDCCYDVNNELFAEFGVIDVEIYNGSKGKFSRLLSIFYLYAVYGYVISVKGWNIYAISKDNDDNSELTRIVEDILKEDNKETFKNIITSLNKKEYNIDDKNKLGEQSTEK